MIKRLFKTQNTFFELKLTVMLLILGNITVFLGLGIIDAYAIKRFFECVIVFATIFVVRKLINLDFIKRA